MIRNRVLSVFLALLLLIHLSACAALSESSAEPDYDEVFVIVHKWPELEQHCTSYGDNNYPLFKLK